MAGWNETLLLCGIAITLGLLQESGANKCFSVLSKCSAQVPITLIPNDASCSRNLSNECTTGTSPMVGQLFQPAFSGFSSGLALLYILMDLAPLMIYLPLLILFNVNLASGPGQSFLFYYQVLPAATQFGRYFSPENIIWAFMTMQSPINDLIFPLTLPYIALQYCKLAVVGLVVVTTVVLIKCIDCPCASWRRPWAKLRRSVRHFREKHAQRGTVLNGLCSIAILTYGFVILQSFSVLQPSRSGLNVSNVCAYYCIELQYFDSDHCHLPFFLVAVLFLLLFLSLPLLLLYYPCVPALMQRITKRSSPLITCHKLAPVFDVFQSAYKPKLKFYAAFPLLYRFGIWMLLSVLSSVPLLGREHIQFFITFVFILILAIHCLVQPYSKPRHNYIEALYLVYLVIISMILTFIRTVGDISAQSLSNLLLLLGVSLLALALALLPLIVGIGWILWKCNCSKRCRAACCERVRQNRREPVEEIAAQLPLSEVYIGMSEVEQSNDD